MAFMGFFLLSQAGRVRVTVVPLPGGESKSSVPPCSLTMPADTDSPSPVPPLSRLVVKNGSVEWGQMFGGDADPLVRNRQHNSAAPAVVDRWPG